MKTCPDGTLVLQLTTRSWVMRGRFQHPCLFDGILYPYRVAAFQWAAERNWTSLLRELKG